MSRGKISIQNLCHISIFTAVIAIMAQISIPTPLGVPLTMQTFAVALAGVVLGAKKGALAAFVYLMLGTFGAPIFANFRGGFDLIIGPTGGFLLSFPLFAFAAGFGADRERCLWLAIGLAVGSAVNLSMGMLQLAFVNQISLQAAFVAGVMPFLPVEMIKMVLVFVIGSRMRKIVEKIKNRPNV